MKFSTRAIHEGQAPDPTTGAVIPPLYLSTTYRQDSPGVHKGYEYSRSQNPTRESLEHGLASLEEGAAGAAFSSGLAATNALLQMLRPGNGVVAGHDLYGGTFRILNTVFKPWGLDVMRAESAEPDAYINALTQLNTPRMVWIESPTNPLLDIVDLCAVCEAVKAHDRSVVVVVDNTFATPYLQQPLALGADYVMHSTTKYLGGHSDVIGGAVVSRTDELMKPIRYLQNAAGLIPGPLDCYLVQRGLKTLAVRMDRHCANAAQLAEALVGLDGLSRVIYPGLPDHPGHAVAGKQMRAFGGMISLEFSQGFEAARSFCSKLRVFSLAESLGGVESLCSHPPSMTHASVPAEERRARGISDGFVRLSVGIEDVDDLLADIRQALTA